jgi:branched-chain amino acid transport system ATP-binding protein
MKPLLELQDVTKRFGGLCAISKCTVAIESKRMHGFIGPNGAGKTTLFNLITGIYQPTEGQIRFKGETIAGLRPSHIAAKGIGRTFQNIRLWKNLTVIENVRIAFDSQLGYSPFQAFLRLARFGRDERNSIGSSLALLESFGLHENAQSLAGELPYGSQRKLEIARALALKPALLLLDEPAAGMNEQETAALTGFLDWVRSHFDVTMALIEHHMHLVMNLCDTITVLDFGEVIAEGAPDAIRTDPRVIKAYLGSDD